MVVDNIVNPHMSTEVGGRSLCICWFCGHSSIHFREGKSIGEMVYSSDIHISSELASEEGAPLTEQHFETLRSAVKICNDCFDRLAESVGPLPADYLRQHARRKELQEWETADTDTHLFPWQNREFPYGCWLTGLPDIGVKSRFSSLPLGHLYECGFRFSGQLSFGKREASLLIDRFAQNEQGVHIPSGFVDHVRDSIYVDDDSFAFRLAGLKAAIFDVAIVYVK